MRIFRSPTGLAGAAALALTAMLATAGSAAAQITFEPDTNRWGADFFAFDMPDSDPQLCRAFCARHIKCMAFTYVRPGEQGPRARCYLKDRVVPATTASCCTSGVKSRRYRDTATVFIGTSEAGAPTPPRPTGVTPESYAEGRLRLPFSLRPLLVLLVEAPPNVAMGSFDRPGDPAPGTSAARIRTRQFFDQLMFGPAEPNIASYFREMSNGQFAWIKAGIIGPILGIGLRDVFRDGVRLADGYSSTWGFNFANFDQDGDGVVRTDELGILVIDNFSDSSGATRPFVTTWAAGSRPQLNVEINIAAAGVNSRFSNFAHELSHSLGIGEDIYSNGCLSVFFTLMSCTAGWTAAPNEFEAYHYDPWNKIRLGWAYPDFVSTAALPRVVSLLAPQSGREVPVILYDPRRGMSEYYVLEYRNPAAASLGPGSSSVNGGLGGYDASVRGTGLVIWYVQTQGGRGDPREILARIRAAVPADRRPGPSASAQEWAEFRTNDARLDTRADSRDQVVGNVIEPGPDGIVQSIPDANDTPETNWLVYVTTDPATQRGRQIPFTPADGPVRLRWFDGTDVGVEIRNLGVGLIAQAVAAPSSIRVRIDRPLPSTLPVVSIDPRLLVMNPDLQVMAGGTGLTHQPDYLPFLPTLAPPGSLEPLTAPTQPIPAPPPIVKKPDLLPLPGMPEKLPLPPGIAKQESPPPPILLPLSPMPEAKKEVLLPLPGPKILPPPPPDAAKIEEPLPPVPDLTYQPAPPSADFGLKVDVPGPAQEGVPPVSHPGVADTNLPGGDIAGPFPLKGGPEECQALCSSEVACTAWTYVKPGIQGPSANCWLKGEVPPAVKDACCVSGMR